MDVAWRPRFQDSGGDVVTKTCAVGHCTHAESKDGLCAIHALTWLLTPEARLQDGPRRAEALRQFVVRQDVRDHLRGQSA